MPNISEPPSIPRTRFRNQYQSRRRSACDHAKAQNEPLSLSLFERPISRRTLVTLSLSLLYLMRFFWRRRRRNILEKRDEEYLYLFFGEVESKKGKEGCNRKNFERNRFLFEDRQEKVYNTDSTINVIDFLLSAR